MKKALKICMSLFFLWVTFFIIFYSIVNTEQFSKKKEINNCYDKLLQIYWWTEQLQESLHKKILEEEKLEKEIQKYSKVLRIALPTLQNFKKTNLLWCDNSWFYFKDNNIPNYYFWSFALTWISEPISYGGWKIGLLKNFFEERKINFTDHKVKIYLWEEKVIKKIIFEWFHTSNDVIGFVAKIIIMNHRWDEIHTVYSTWQINSWFIDKRAFTLIQK